MRYLNASKFVAVIIILMITSSAINAQHKRYVRNPERALFGKSLGTRKVKYRESPSVERAKKKQQENLKKLDKEFADAVKANRKHALEIQTPEVRDRMIANRKEADTKYKEKNKQVAKSQKARRKYK